MNPNYEAIIIKDTPHFRLSMKKWPATKPENTYCVELTGISLNGQADPIVSTYQFFMTDAELKLLANALVK